MRSSPRTPPSRAARGKGRSKASRVRPAVRDTFKSDDARRSVNQHHRIGSDLHDLAWSPRQTRDSVVDNMLLSLDQLFVPSNQPKGSTNADYAAGEESIRNANGEQSNRYSTPRYDFSRQRGHTISSSLSSEHDFPTVDNTSHLFNRPSRGHRSNSSGNFQSALRRIDSLHVGDGGKKNIRGRLYETQRATAPRERSTANRSHGKKGSKSSGSSSLDLGQVLGGSRWQPAFERRPSSIDLSTDDKGGVTSGFSGIPRSAFSTSRPKEIEYDDLEAAPTPTIPAGPRSRNRSPAKAHLPKSHTLPSASYTLPLPKTPLGRQTWPDRADSAMKKDKKGLDERAVHDAKKKQDSLNPRRYNAISSTDKPVVGPSPGSAIQTKERPGFFKRVFGSSSRNVTPPSNDAFIQKPLPLSRDGARADSRAGQISEKQSSAHSLVGSAATDSKELPQVPLNKKTSFFRRRKKSVSGDAPLPLFPPELQNQSYGQHAMVGVDASSASSLRKVMDPYLNSPGPPHYRRDQLLDDHAGNDDSAYLAGYAARNESSKRPDTNAYKNVHNSPDILASKHRKVTLPMRDNPKPRSYTSDDSHNIPGDSFLHDSSGNEGKADVDGLSDMPAAKLDKGCSEETRFSESSSRREVIKPLEEKENPKSIVANSKVNVKNNTSAQVVPLSTRASNTANITQDVRTPRKVNLKDWNTPRGSPSVDKSPSKSSVQHSPRIFLAPTDSEEKLAIPSDNPPQLEKSQSSTHISEGDSSLLTLKPSGSADNLTREQHEPSKSRANEPSKDEELALETELSNESSFVNVDRPSEADRVQARKIFDGEDSQIDKADVVPWLGEPYSERTRIRRAYMELFDFQNLDILTSLRGLCGRILLKGETQQLDRIIGSFSKRWCQCNPHHGFKATGMLRKGFVDLVL